MTLNPIDVDPHFADFNVLEMEDPRRAKEYLDQAQLLELAYDGRGGHVQSLFKFAEVMFCTLGEQTFEDFLRAHAPGDYRFREWFYQKLYQFVRILVYESIRVTSFENDNLVFGWTDFPLDTKFNIIGFSEDLANEYVRVDWEIEDAIQPEHNVLRPWYSLVRAIADRPKARLQAAREWLAKFGGEHRPPPSVDSGWTKNRQRDRIILNGLAKGMSHMEICQELDKFAIPVIKALHMRAFTKWIDGWHDSTAQNAIYQLFKKVSDRRLKPVKTSIVSN